MMGAQRERERDAESEGEIARKETEIEEPGIRYLKAEEDLLV